MTHGKLRLTHLVTDDGRRYHTREEKGPEHRYGKQFMITFVEAVAKAAVELTGTEMRVLFRATRHLSYKDFRLMSREMLAAELNLTGSVVSKSLIRLAELGYVERKGKGPVTQWRLSLDLGWQGSAPAYHKERRARATPPKPKLRVIQGVASAQT